MLQPHLGFHKVLSRGQGAKRLSGVNSKGGRKLHFTGSLTGTELGIYHVYAMFYVAFLFVFTSRPLMFMPMVPGETDCMSFPIDIYY